MHWVHAHCFQSPLSSVEKSSSSLLLYTYLLVCGNLNPMYLAVVSLSRCKLEGFVYLQPPRNLKPIAIVALWPADMRVLELLLVEGLETELPPFSMNMSSYPNIQIQPDASDRGLTFESDNTPTMPQTNF